MSVSLLDDERIDALINYLQIANELEGDIAEVGVYKGGSARTICLHAPKKHVLLFDTFDGMPPTKDIDEHKQGDFANTSLEEVAINLRPMVNYELHQGVFPKKQVSKFASFRKFCLVHIDVDIYDSVKDCLTFFYPRMVSGGFIVLDDYNAPMCKGAKLAVDEFLTDKPEKIERHVSCSVMFRKQ